MRGWLTTLLLVGLLPKPAFAGDMPGMAPSLPPTVQQQFQLTFSNDFLGRGGSVDDFRTQQIIVDFDLGDRWTAILDHSVLTLTDPLGSGRIDQLSGSLGYRWIEHSGPAVTSSLITGFGFRQVGDIAGERMQNGFHRLISSDVENLPYSTVDGTYATAWLDTEHYREMLKTPGGWSIGYWARGRALATSDGQLDSAISIHGTANIGKFDAWAGLRQDWRSGYDEPVQSATAAAEEDLAFILGVRLGSLVLETVQQFESDASFGQLRLLSLESDAPASRTDTRLAIEFGFLLPDVHLHLAGRMRSSLFAAYNSVWRESIVITVDTGEPQVGDDAAVYNESLQIAAGLEWERPLTTTSDWLGFYASAGAGWRQERLVGEGVLLGTESESTSAMTLVAGAGLRFNASVLSHSWRYRIQVGVTAWIPTEDAELTFDGRMIPVLEPTAALSLGVSFEFN